MKKIHPFRLWLAENGLKPTRGYQLVKEGKIKTVKIGKNRFITEEAAQAFVDSLTSELGKRGV